MVDAEELARLLAGTALDGRPVVPATPRCLAVRCEPEEVWPAWQAARSVAGASGRWPVVMTDWDDRGDPAWPSGGRGSASEHVRATLAAAATADPWTTFGPDRRDEPLDEAWVGIFAREDGSTESEARDLIARGVTGTGVDRIRLDRRIARAGGRPEDVRATAFTDRDTLWFVPTGQPCAVLFLDTDRTWESAAQLSYFGALDPDRQAALVAAEREWHERWGAELVASWDTMLQFVTHRRPGTLDEAWDLAGQLLLVGGSLQMDRSDLALALMRTDYWFLHDRP